MSSISIVIISNLKAGRLQACLQSIKESAVGLSDSSQIEVVLVVNSDNISQLKFSTDVYERNNLFVSLNPIDASSKSIMRNHGVNIASGQIVYFLDDDVFVDKSFLGNILKEFDNNEVAVIGGPNLTPKDSTAFERAQGYVLASFWGTFTMSNRYKIPADAYFATEKDLILCNVGIRRDILKKEEVFFDDRLEYNEENHLFNILAKRGYRFLMIPSLAVYHHRRRNWKSYAVQVFSSGRGRARSIRLSSRNINAVYFIPLLCLLYVCMTPFLMKFGAGVLLPYEIYFLLHLLLSLKVFVKYERSIKMFFMVFLVVWLGHVSYGLGTFKGFTEKL